MRERFGALGAGVWAALAGCAGSGDADVRALIEAELQRGVEATRTKDSDTYMDLIPDESLIHDESGGVLTREALRAAVVRDWAIVDRTLAIGINGAPYVPSDGPCGREPAVTWT